MTSQGKLFKLSSIAALVGIFFPVILILAFGHATGAAASVLIGVTVTLSVVAAMAIPVALATYRERGRKPGSLPLIYAVIAFPAGFILMFVYFAIQFPSVMFIALIGIITSVPALVIGIVKKLSVKTPPPVASAASISE